MKKDCERIKKIMVDDTAKLLMFAHVNNGGIVKIAKGPSIALYGDDSFKPNPYAEEMLGILIRPKTGLTEETLRNAMADPDVIYISLNVEVEGLDYKYMFYRSDFNVAHYVYEDPLEMLLAAMILLGFEGELYNELTSE